MNFIFCPIDNIINSIILNKIPKLFFGIITIESSTKRREVMYDVWLQKILELGHDYIYTTQNPIESKFKWTPLKNWTTHYPKTPNDMFISNRDRENKRITLADYFLHTDSDFFINPTDDVFVDASRINKLALELGKKYDTENDIVMKGNCMFDIIHGGSGYIMTRAMARKFVNLSDRWLRESSGPDDKEMNKMLGYVKQTISNCSSPYTSGRIFGIWNLKMNFSSCRKDFYDSNCKQSIYRLEDSYMMHPTGPKIGDNLRIWNNYLYYINDKKHHYGWYPGASQVHEVCIFD